MSDRFKAIQLAETYESLASMPPEVAKHVQSNAYQYYMDRMKREFAPDTTTGAVQSNVNEAFDKAMKERGWI